MSKKQHMAEISFDERKQIQLEMLDEIHSFCISNNIRYSLAFGTLLGAIRHKGFIPWDDDVDIMMPLPDLLRFKHEFVSDKLVYCDVDNTDGYEFHFSRVCHKLTYQTIGRYHTYGICVDLYVIVSIPDALPEQNEFFDKAQSLFNRRINSIVLNNRLLRYSPLSKPLAGLRKRVLEYRDYFFYAIPYGQTHHYYILAGAVSSHNKMQYDCDLFDSLCEVSFEGKSYLSISRWDYFLFLRYGNYMELPPEDQRCPYHDFHYYWK